MAPLKHPITALPVRDSDQPADVRIVAMTDDLVKIWDEKIQPRINKNYRISSDVNNFKTDGKLKKVRADVGWSWPNIRQLKILHDIAHPSYLSSTSPALELCLVIDYEGNWFPIGMLTLVPKYRCKVPSWGHKTYTWHLSNAPEEVYRDLLGEVYVYGVAEALIDCAIQASYHVESDGSLLLRADPNGGERLQKFYRKCSFDQVKIGNGRISNYRWRNNTQYFHLSMENAKSFCENNDAWR